jgi:hypothetical protein
MHVAKGVGRVKSGLIFRMAYIKLGGGWPVGIHEELIPAYNLPLGAWCLVYGVLGVEYGDSRVLELMTL